MTEQIGCDRCGWDPRATDRIHVCRSFTNRRVAGPARGGGEIFGHIIEEQNGTSALVKWDGNRRGQWYPLAHLRMVGEDEAA